MMSCKMTLSSLSAAPQPAYVPMPERSDEQIGLELRRIRKKKFGERGSLAKIAKDADVSIALLGAIERGDHSLIKVSQERVARLAQAYGLSAEEFADMTGLSIVVPDGERRRATLEMFVTVGQPIPEALVQAGKQYGGEIAKPEWQRELASMRFRDGQPETAEDWYYLFRTLVSANVVPREDN